jgi:hypothetical protein
MYILIIINILKGWLYMKSVLITSAWIFTGLIFISIIEAIIKYIGPILFILSLIITIILLYTRKVLLDELRER